MIKCYRDRLLLLTCIVEIFSLALGIRISPSFYHSSFYRAMHFSAKRGIAIACRLSVRPSVCDVGEL